MSNISITDELVMGEVISSEDEAKLKRMLVGEVYQGHCPMCQKLAVRIFEPRKKLDAIMKKKGIKEVMKQCGTDVVNERILVDMPSFNMILTGKHREIDSYNLAYTSYNSCNMGVMITDNPRGFVWHLFSRLRAVRMACLMNGISYAEVKAWFDALSVADATYLIQDVIDFVKIPDRDGKLNEGPWFVGWMDTSKIQGINPNFFAIDANGDPLWDTCLDPMVADNMEINSVEYSTTATGDNLIDIPKFDLIAREVYTYSREKEYFAVSEPVNNPNNFFEFEVGVVSDVIPGVAIFPRFKASVPLKYWCIEASRFKIGKDKTSNNVVDLEAR